MSLSNKSISSKKHVRSCPLNRQVLENADCSCAVDHVALYETGLPSPADSEFPANVQLERAKPSRLTRKRDVTVPSPPPTPTTSKGHGYASTWPAASAPGMVLYYPSNSPLDAPVSVAAPSVDELPDEEPAQLAKRRRCKASGVARAGRKLKEKPKEKPKAKADQPKKKRARAVNGARWVLNPTPPTESPKCYFGVFRVNLGDAGDCAGVPETLYMREYTRDVAMTTLEYVPSVE
ncbi:hypothetical protein CTheo_7643 [Ceratobasidium theobromae]|uniref:Uncharacterized protein n=1 Tax=Ceratobasidium theobromae TaxID=1582974 RepID=A0A5N5QBX0_9AGAM|nr:hypothetical protein CTheo_7643 [Ceratobasidium theobromae]